MAVIVGYALSGVLWFPVSAHVLLPYCAAACDVQWFLRCPDNSMLLVQGLKSALVHCRSITALAWHWASAPPWCMSVQLS